MDQGWSSSSSGWYLAPRPSRRRRNVLLATTAVVVGGTLIAAVAVGSGGGDPVVEPAESSEIVATTIDPFPDVEPEALFDPDSLYVALYGHPDSPVLGVMGEQDVDVAIERARAVAAEYEGFGRPVVPSFEIIVTVASVDPGSDGDYSNEFADAKFLPWIEAAGAAGMHVVVDLQSGRDTFSNQAREIEALLRHPHVSLALDPEWRVGPAEIPGGGLIGTVSAAEVNETIEYLDELIERNGLPPKMMVLHQFRPEMITDKQQIRSTPDVQVVVQMDGFGNLSQKFLSWDQMTADLPPGALTGWKNFYDEDLPTPSATQSLSVVPRPVYVSYQ